MFLAKEDIHYKEILKKQLSEKEFTAMITARLHAVASKTRSEKTPFLSDHFKTAIASKRIQRNKSSKAGMHNPWPGSSPRRPKKLYPALGAG